MTPATRLCLLYHQYLVRLHGNATHNVDHIIAKLQLWNGGGGVTVSLVHYTYRPIGHKI